MVLSRRPLLVALADDAIAARVRPGTLGKADMGPLRRAARLQEISLSGWSLSGEYSGRLTRADSSQMSPSELAPLPTSSKTCLVVQPGETASSARLIA